MAESLLESQRQAQNMASARVGNEESKIDSDQESSSSSFTIDEIE
jgi:hypothetical protein